MREHAHLYSPVAGDAQRSRRRKPLPSAAPSPLFKRIRHALPEDLRVQYRESREYDDIIAAFDDLERAVLIGEPGAGKTTALYRLAQQYLEPAARDPEAPLPVLVPLGEWLAPDQSLAACLATRLGDLGDYLPALLVRHRLVLLLDGLNEIPVVQQPDKARQIARWIEDDKLRLIVSCREQDYRDHLTLDLDTLAIRPLTPSRILAFIERYLIAAHEGDRQRGREAAQTLFWTLAGGEAVRDLWNTWHEAGAPDLDFFWAVEEIPRDNPTIHARTTAQEDALWRDRVKDRRSLMRLAGNPFLLYMMIGIYWETGRLPANRASLFGAFIKLLLAREGLADRETLDDLPDGARLLDALGELAWRMQHAGLYKVDDPVLETTTQVALNRHFLNLDKQQLKQALAASLLEGGGQVRFSHQLLQEYFVALGLRTRIETGRFAATDLWPPEHWWQRSGWEEAAILLAGLYPEDCTPIIDWLCDAQPEVAAQCINRSGAKLPEATLRRLRDAWLPRLTDLECDPDPRARAAVGRALGSLSLDGRPLDDRPGVRGLYIAEQERAEVDIDWVEIPGGKFIYQDGEQRELDTFRIARYPITHSQFQAFIDDPQGYSNKRWWRSLAKRYNTPAEPEWTYHNHPRETVSWYEAVAFCNWLSALRDETITLPTETQWERAARGRDGREYPWGEGYRSGYANTSSEHSGHGQTTAVGIYPQGGSTEGVLDLSGNVFEWCLNEFLLPDRTALSGIAPRVVRGGSWSDRQVSARAVNRGDLGPHYRYGSLGFRVVRSSS